MTGWLACFYVRMCLWLICCCQWSMTEGWARTRSWSRTWARARAWTKAEAGTRTRTKSKTRTRFWNPFVWEHVQTHFFLIFFVDAKDFSQTLVILSSMFNLPIFKYATAHWFCLDPALWASFFRTDLCVSFHKFSLFLISQQKMRPPIAFWWPNFWFFAKYATTHRFCLDPALWANFLEPISVGAVTNSHFFDFRRKFRDPSYYFDDRISVFAKYATTHRFCLDPALWASFFGTDLYGGFHDFSLFWILPKILWPLLLLWWPNFCFCKKWQKSRIWKIMKIFAPPLAITKLFFLIWRSTR